MLHIYIVQLNLLFALRTGGRNEKYTETEIFPAWMEGQAKLAFLSKKGGMLTMLSIKFLLLYFVTSS